MTRHLWIWLYALPMGAHMVSMSTGELRIDGRRGDYELRMPLYEVAHVKAPDRTLFENIHFRTSGTEARLLRKSCREEAADGAYACQATYEFAADVDKLEVECTFPAVTVPNHVHLLRVVKSDRTDQAVLDYSFPRAELNFRPPTAGEIALQQASAGILRAVGGAAQILFLAALILAARRRRELMALTAMFLTGEIISCLVVQASAWQPAPRFVEAAAALTIAYLAVEILLLPDAGQRWLVVLVLGVFHGLYFALFLANSGYKTAYVLTGVAVAEILTVGLFALVLSRLQRLLAAFRPLQVSACGLLVVGMVWFFVRLKG